MPRRSALTGIAIVLYAFVCHAARGAAPVSPTRFTVEVTGKGPDVILIPGLSCSREVYRPLAAVLSQHYRLHLVQINGFAGQSAGPNANGPFLAPVEAELAGYIEQNHLNRPAVIGHSIGGLLGIMLSADHPSDVGKLLLVDSLPFFAVIFNPSATVETMKPQAAAMQSQMISMSDEDFSKTQPVMLGSMVESPDGLKQATRWALESDRKVVAQATYDDLTTDMRPRLTSIRAPIVLIYPWEPALGTKEQVDSFYITQYAGAAIFKSRRIEGSRHFIMFDQPQLFADAISTFLQG